MYERFRDKYQLLVRNEITIWLNFHHYWLTTAASVIPVLLVRYEDLVRNTQEQLTRMMEFALQVEKLDSYWIARVDHAVSDVRRSPRAETKKTASPSTPIHQLGSYRPRTRDAVALGSSRSAVEFGKAMKRQHITEELVRYIHDASERFDCNYLKMLGYDVLHDKFPEQLPQLSLDGLTNDRCSRVEGMLTINDGCTIRPLSCPFGRGMRAWRQSVTDNDRAPLPTAQI
jgi:hypothetical protein